MPTIKLRRDTAANWTSVNPVLNEGEMGLETDTNKLKIGDGYNTWSDRGYINTDTAYGTFNPSSTRSYTGSSASDGLGVKPIIAGDRNVIDNTGQGQIKIHTAETGSLERTLVSPNSGDANYVGWGGSGKLSADATFLATVEYEGSGVPSNALIHIHNLTTGALVNTVTRAIASTDYNGSEFNWGANIHLRGNYLLVSSSKGTAGGQTEAGSVQVYKTATGDWTDMALHGTVDNPSPAASDQWGDSISILGEFALVGCPSKTVSSQANAGSVSVVHMEDLSVVSTIDNPSPAEGDSFGSSVDFMTDYEHIAIGCEGDEEGAEDNSGAVYIYKTTAGDWTDGSQVTRISNPNSNTFNAGDKFGSSVSSYGKYLAVAAKDEDNTSAPAPDYTSISLEATIANPTPGDNDFFGTGVAMSDSYYAISSPGDNNKLGAVYVYDRATGNLLQTIVNPNLDNTQTSDGDKFGNMMAMTDNYLACASPGEDAGDGDNRIYIFNPSTGTLLRSILPPNNALTARFTIMSMTDSVLGFGVFTPTGTSYWASDTVHQVLLYDPSTGNLTATLNNPNPYGSANGEAFGYTVAMNDSYIAVSAAREDSASNTEVGVVHLFDTSGGFLRVIESPDDNAYLNFGQSVDVSNDYLVVGAPSYDSNTENNVGRVYVFNPSDGSHLRTIENPNPQGTGVSDGFGYRMRVDGSKFVTLANGEDIGGIINNRPAYVYDAATGNLLSTLENPSSENAQYGWDMEFSGRDIIIGSPNHDATGDDYGIAYHWKAPLGEGATGTVDYSQSSLDATLEGTGYTPGVRGAAGFGEVSAISSDGSYAVTGTEEAWVSSTGSSYTGEVSVIDTSTNSVVHTLNNPNSGQHYFGSGVAINNTFTAVGAKYETVNGQSRQGRVYIFSNATGSLVHTINSPNSGSNVHFGEALAMDETHLVIGEPNNTSSKKVHLYSVDSSSASLVWTSTRSDAESAWGSRVALSDSYVAVGTDNGNAASVLSRSNGSILRTFTDPAGDGTEQAFGETVSITDDYIAIGSSGWDKQFQGVGIGNYSSGRVYIYDPSNGNAVRTISNPNNSGVVWNDKFGYMVSIKGDYLLASATEETYGSDETGTCYIIDVTTGSTVKVITSANPKANGSFGRSVQISDSGKFVIGASQEGTNSSGHLYVYEAPTGEPPGASSGANYIFKTTDSTWTDTGLCATLANPDTTPETADNDALSGISLGNDRFLAGYAAAGTNQGTGKVEEYDLYE